MATKDTIATKGGPDDGSRTPEQSRVTINQVAALAGVSPTTVSHVLSGKRLVARRREAPSRTRSGVLGYRPNYIAR